MKRKRIVGLIVTLIFIGMMGIILALLMTVKTMLEPPLPFIQPGTTTANWVLIAAILTSAYYCIRGVMIAAGITPLHFNSIVLSKLFLEPYALYVIVPAATGTGLFFLIGDDKWGFGLIFAGIATAVICFLLESRHASNATNPQEEK